MVMDPCPPPTRSEPRLVPGEGEQGVLRHYVDIQAPWRYRHRIRNQIYAWYAQQNLLPICTSTPGYDRYFFHSAAERTLFVLKWS